MESIVFRMMQRGRRSPPHVANAAPVRGRVIVEDENLRDRGLVRVARVVGSAIPPLIDARLLPSAGDRWRLAGLECVPDGPLQDEVLFAQVWEIELAVSVDLERELSMTRQALRKALGDE